MDNRVDKWYDTEEDKAFEEAIGRIKAAIKQGLSFEQSLSLVEDAKLRQSVEDDALKVLIAEMHLIGKKSLHDLSVLLKVPVARLAGAKKEMLEDIEQTAIDAYKTDAGKAGTA